MLSYFIKKNYKLIFFFSYFFTFYNQLSVVFKTFFDKKISPKFDSPRGDKTQLVHVFLLFFLHFFTKKSSFFINFFFKNWCKNYFFSLFLSSFFFFFYSFLLKNLVWYAWLRRKNIILHSKIERSRWFLNLN